MMKLSKSSATVLIILGCFFIGFLAKFAVEHSASLIRPDANLARAKGNPKAPVRVTEFVDFQCKACSKGVEVLRNYFKKYPQKIYIEVKHYPLSKIHWHAVKSAVYAECAARQNKFWPYQDLLFQNQQIWDRLINPDNMFKELAQKAGLNLSALDVCVQDEKIKKFVLDEKSQGEAMRVNSTPTYFINGKMLVGHKELSAELEKLFQEETK